MQDECPRWSISVSYNFVITLFAEIWNMNEVPKKEHKKNNLARWQKDIHTYSH